jgi:hypothetical protein
MFKTATVHLFLIFTGAQLPFTVVQVRGSTMEYRTSPLQYLVSFYFLLGSFSPSRRL